ncbi:hypothetical protein EI94DRAFT_1588344, partial [Lactarius quietus]
LPNMQIARCAWKETAHMCSAECIHQSHNVKFPSGESFQIGEVQFFFRSNHSGSEHAYALISVWSDLDMDMLRNSSNTVYSCAYRGQEDLQVIDRKAITSVVAMIPMTPCDGDHSTCFFLLNNPGLDLHILGDTMNIPSE